MAGFTEFERGTSTAPFLLAPVAIVTPSPLVNPDMIRYTTPGMKLTSAQTKRLATVQLSAEERSDNTRYDGLMMAAAPTQMTRVSYWWPASFFEQNGQQVHLHFLITPGLDQNSLLSLFYKYAAKSTRYGTQGAWFKIWNGAALKPGFIYRKGDIINFGGGHTSIVVGDNLFADVVVSEMSYNRTRQGYPTGPAFDADFSPGVFDNYGVTRDKLSDLRNGLGPASIAGEGRPENAFTQKDYEVYRLMNWLTSPAPQFYQLNALANPAPVRYNTYRVAKGDTLSAIAQKMGSNVAAIAEANGIPDPDWVEAGDLLYIP